MYCCSVWDDLSQTLNDKLQKLQNRAARVITNLGILQVQVLFWTCLDGIGFRLAEQKKGSRHVQNTLQLNAPLHERFALRRSENILHVPKPRTDYLKRSLRYSGAVLWNGLPSEISKPLTVKRFKKGIIDLYS